MKAFQKTWFIEGIAFESGNKHQNPITFIHTRKLLQIVIVHQDTPWAQDVN